MIVDIGQRVKVAEKAGAFMGWGKVEGIFERGTDKWIRIVPDEPEGVIFEVSLRFFDVVVEP